jgi:hypothetical protein
MHSWNTFGARMNHRQTRTHKTHHNPNLGEATTIPFIVFFVTGLAPKCHFVLGFPSWSLKILKIGTPTILEAHNFFHKPSNKMRFKAKL